MKEFTTLTQKDSDEFGKYISEMGDGAYRIKITKVKDVRTEQQRKSIELFCKLLAGRLNDAGMYMVKTLKVLRKKPEVDVQWTQEEVKDRLWRPVQRALYEKESTTDLNIQEVSQVYEILNKNLSEKIGVGCEFPDRFGLMYQQNKPNG